MKLRSSRFQLGMTKVTRGVAVHNREVRSVKVPEFGRTCEERGEEGVGICWGFMMSE